MPTSLVPTSTLDVITVEVIRSALESLAEQMTDTMERTSYSLLLKEGKDCSSSIFDVSGRLVAEGANIPVHLNALGPCLRAMLQEHIPASDMKPGDIILTNDPYVGGSVGAHHTSDFIVYHPIFLGEKLIGFSTIFAHLAGSGGNDPEGWHTTIFEEGLRIPPIKLFNKGVLDEQLFKLILANTNSPYEQRGDILGQVAGAKVGSNGFLALVEKYGLFAIDEAIDSQIDYAERRTRSYISQIADGRYFAETTLLEDGSMCGPVKLALTVIVAGDEITFDFTGTDASVAGPINCPMSATISASLFGLLSLLPTDIPKNEGSSNPVHIVAPEGSLVNPRFPAAVYQRMAVTHQIVDLVFEALAPAVPAAVVANSCGMVYCVASAINLESHPDGGDVSGRRGWGNGAGPSVGGLGARATKDGLTGMPGWITNVASTSIESSEVEGPVRYLRKELRPGSAGPGKYRGGLGVILSWQALGNEVKFSHTSQRSVIPPHGLFGGGSGGVSRWIINEGTPAAQVLANQAGPTLDLEFGDTVTFYAPGGGGYGDPLERDSARVARDCHLGYIDAAQAEADYGVVLTLDGLVDAPKTAAVRSSRATASAPPIFPPSIAAANNERRTIL
ncbi:hydantoinase B/oxoprolinase family protein [Cryobacterium sp. PH31-L1]|uniref:hydantoinase B/oxoprolinase family protein n=1 Tax=Cryobacterium sp. PH31-L1 TaxID=3046199 RepID=UPI0024BA5F36|nr:hydantoinase B/oxoprolinase family protein [Cryobacterium sp. PH31-L1]MDJ0378460.1 hydantoinase B/oxoprolinase family protein [Cryobacterium sp. PH31-L1]